MGSRTLYKVATVIAAAILITSTLLAGLPLTTANPGDPIEWYLWPPASGVLYTDYYALYPLSLIHI